MATENLDSAVKGEEYLSIKVEDEDGGTFDDDYPTDFLAGMATISNRISQVRDEVYQRCGSPKRVTAANAASRTHTAEPSGH